jgi:hypothetical protein
LEAAKQRSFDLPFLSLRIAPEDESAFARTDLQLHVTALWFRHAFTPESRF